MRTDIASLDRIASLALRARLNIRDRTFHKLSRNDASDPVDFCRNAQRLVTRELCELNADLAYGHHGTKLAACDSHPTIRGERSESFETASVD